MAMTAMVYDEKKTVMAGQLRTILHNNHVCGPKGQYLVNIPSKVIGIVIKHRVESATARVAMKMFLAVLIAVDREKGSHSR